MSRRTTDEIIKETISFACSAAKQTIEKYYPHLNGDIQGESLLANGKGKTMLAVSIAKELTVLYLHNTYGLTYRNIAKHLNLSCKEAAIQIAAKLNSQLANKDEDICFADKLMNEMVYAENNEEYS